VDDSEKRRAHCPDCGAGFLVPVAGPGRKETCPLCGATFRIGTARGYQQVQPERLVMEEPWPAEEPGGSPLGSPDIGDVGGPVLVCCAREQKLNPLAVGPVVQAFTGLARREAMMHVNKGKGILAEGLSPDTAAALVEKLEQLPLEVFVLPEACVPPVARQVDIVRVHSADESALHVQTDAEGSVKAIRWAQLAVGLCTKEKFGGRTVVDEQVDRSPVVYGAGGVPAVGWSTVRRTKRRKEEAHLRITLVLRDGTGRAYPMAFDETEVRYAYLGERMRPSSRENVGVFLDDVLRWGSPAFFPAGYRAVACGQPYRVTQVVGRLDYENYVRWAICCAAAQGLFAPM